MVQSKERERFDPDYPTTSTGSEYSELVPLVGREVVLDTKSHITYLGRLYKVSANFFILEDADVHDLSTSTMTREVDLSQARTHGIHVSRARVYVRANQVMSVSELDDIMTY
jgi:small nuclear ribonucleoprotein (snRNP)-like protein